MVKITNEMRKMIEDMVRAEKNTAGEYNETTDMTLRKNCSDTAAFKAAYARWFTRIS